MCQDVPQAEKLTKTSQDKTNVTNHTQEYSNITKDNKGLQGTQKYPGLLKTTHAQDIKN